MRYAWEVTLAAGDLAAYANDVVGTFGIAVVFEPPRDARGHDRIRAHVREALLDVQSLADDPSIGEAVTALLALARRGWPDRSLSGRLLAELQALFVHASFRRTKRAERARRFAQLVVLFELEPSMGLERYATGDLEQHLRRVRRRLRERG